MPSHSYQSKLYYSTDGNTYTEVTGLRSLTAPELSATAAPADALSDLGKITVAGKVDLGEFTGEILFDKTVYAALYALHRVTRYWRAQYPDASPVTNGSKVEFTGYIRTIGAPNMTDDEVLACAFGVKVASTPTFTAAV